MDERLQTDPRPPPDVSGSDSLGSVDLVTRHAKNVNVHLVDVNLYLTDGLSGIGVEEDASVLATDGANLLERLDDANLVVDGHDRNEGRIGSDRGLELLKRNETVLLDGKVGDVEAVLAEVSARVEDTFVLL